MDNPGYHWSLEPINFSGDAIYFGWFRLVNVIKPVHDYLNGRAYDPVFYAPKDRLSLAAAEPCMDDPGEFTAILDCNPPVWPTYCWSPAALYNPQVFRNDEDGGFQAPFSLPSGFRVPTMSQATYPSLKTHMLEHQWLQNVEVECNPAFGGFGGVLDCEPYYFNHALNSKPVTLFYDAHVDLIGTHQAMLDDRRHRNQVQNPDWGLWSTDTPFGGDVDGTGDGGYLIGSGYDWANTSYHILTTEGIHGRDILGKQ